MTSLKSSPFTQCVVEAVRKLYPEKLADSSFDNTGLLLEAPFRNYSSDREPNNSVLLAVDLTRGVAEEAIRRKDAVIIAYHPIIFRPLKALTLRNPQQSTLLRLAQEGISVYSPHTAVDAAPGGLNDWLADIVTGKTSNGETESNNLGTALHDRSAITPVTGVPGFEDAGYGRIVRFHSPQKLGVLLSRIIEGLGSLAGLSVAVPQTVPRGSRSELEVSSIGICAGSGGSMLNGLNVDLLFTGELSHHEALAAIEQDKIVVTAFHSNTERAFLKQRMQHVLLAEINASIEKLSMESADALPIEDPEVAVSEVDRDPFEIVIAGQAGW